MGTTISSQAQGAFPDRGRSRTIIQSVTPQIDSGRHPIQRTIGQRVVVEADVFADGHDVVSAVLKHRHEGSRKWSETPMIPLTNDRWRGEFTLSIPGRHHYTIEAWVDHFQSWRRDFQKKVAAGQDVSADFLTGAALIQRTAQRANGLDADRLTAWASEFSTGVSATGGPLLQRAEDPEMLALAARYPDRRWANVFEPELTVVADPPLARFSAWYEMFPRSTAAEPGRHGTFKDCEAHLPRIAKMGFDVLYFPPIHPIGRTLRRGRNNSPECKHGEPGSPWAIGAREGGHKSVHPRLGTADDFRRLVRRAREQGLEIALDIAFQCSPDHPYVHEHPEWFLHRPDGSIQCAENPPKKYDDIYPFDFECDDWTNLWTELKSIFEHWIEQGVRIFRVDNPHTKSFPFWEWCLGELKRKEPDLIFLAEAFTRPKVMECLAKAGFTQSYNYFPWRNGKAELTEYFTELSHGPMAEFFRPSLWPNTPDILTEYLQHGGRPAFIIRLVLAATLGTNYGIYGPAFELCEHTAREPGSEEYLDSEKYEIKCWDVNAPHSLRDVIARVNRIRRENPSLQFNERLAFLPVDNDRIIAYTKTLDDRSDAVLTVVNLDPHHTHGGWLELPLADLGLLPGQTYQMHDLLTDARYFWQGSRNYVELKPETSPAHIFRLRQRIRSEQDFDYYA